MKMTFREKLKYHRFGYLNKGLYKLIRKFLMFGLDCGMRVKLKHGDKYTFVGFSIPHDHLDKDTIDQLGYELEMLKNNLKEIKK